MPQSIPKGLTREHVIKARAYLDVGIEHPFGQSIGYATVLLLLAGLVFAAPPKVVEEFSGKVIGVTDGDTIKVLVNKETVTVRLEGIDAPEKSQSFGKKVQSSAWPNWWQARP